MLDTGKLNMVYFVGAGGIGMSALARYFNYLGGRVAGYDLTETALTRKLEQEGIEITYSDDPGEIPRDFTDRGPAEDMVVVYTPAVPETNNILRWFRDNGYSMVKRSRLLGELVNRGRGIAVAGTHGKTSVSSLAAHLLRELPDGCNAFIGGIAKNFNSNLLVSGKSDLFVVEADEYDRSFLQLFPTVAVITSMDPDHLDIYGSYDEMACAFSAFAGQVRQGGILLYKEGVDPGVENSGNIRHLSYSAGNPADYYAQNLKISKNGLAVFDLVTPNVIYRDMELGIPGRFNVENAVAAAAVAMLCGLDETAVRKGLISFSGIYRRFDIRINKPGCVLIDDYAHHPAELSACISAVREIFGGRRITGIFQPHLYSRTRDFADGFAGSLNELDDLILLDIYPAREKPLKGVTSELIFEKVKLKSRMMCQREELPKVLGGMATDVVITMGAGNIDAMVEPVEKVLLSKTRLR
ncbi:MAG: UDP-N-acetylmuramate--L-alanine ligase [Marinilabiliales bacterium]|nr:MAG: UDP-N-acetylmuramate--L-alanine ligase [Marinilabiliales bacterium]